MIRYLAANNKLEPLRLADGEGLLVMARKAKRVGADAWMVVDGETFEVVLDDVERDFEDRRTARHALILKNKRGKKVPA